MMNKCMLMFLCLCFGFAKAQIPSTPAWDSLPVFTQLDQALQHPELVYRLDLSKNKLKAWPAEIFTLTNLIELKLAKNKLTEVPKEIAQLHALQWLDLSHNEIESLPNELWQLNGLIGLHAADNILSTLSPQIANLQQLRELVLYDNPLEEYPDELEELKQLEVLDLLHNNISYDTQDRIKELLPDTRILMSPPCHCADGE